MSGMDEAGLLVSPWTVLMAVRYGMGRFTYANLDAASLARTHWDSFDRAAQQTIRDDAGRLEGYERQAWAWLLEGDQA